MHSGLQVFSRHRITRRLLGECSLSDRTSTLIAVSPMTGEGGRLEGCGLTDIEGTCVERGVFTGLAPIQRIADLLIRIRAMPVPLGIDP